MELIGHQCQMVVENYIDLHLTCHVYEIKICAQLKNFLQNNIIISNQQYNFIKNKSTYTAVFLFH